VIGQFLAAVVLLAVANCARYRRVKLAGRDVIGETPVMPTGVAVRTDPPARAVALLGVG
jgi:hypothetical protein